MLFIFLLPGILFSCSNNDIKNDKANGNDSISKKNTLSQILQGDDWESPDTNSIPNNNYGDLVRYGRKLIVSTAEYFGPKGKINHFANGMNCQNCHLEAGTKLYANSYSAVFSNYPKFRPRSGTVENLVKRIDDCMERSLNGKKIDSLGIEMKAMITYINWVGKDVKKGETPKGASVVNLPWLDRAADKDKGEIVFKKNCITCHHENGQGELNPDSITYKYPPLWGPNSYNTAAGLYRLSRLAGFIKSNMPNLKSSVDKPTLTDEEAWDIAAFISSMPRPERKFIKDWPDISKKPVDLPFGPYADRFSETQHKYGPFKELLSLSKK